MFEKKVAHAITDTALAVAEFEKLGEVKITLKLRPTPASGRINVEHRIDVSKPKLRGTKKEDDTTETPMHVGQGGRLTFFPEAQRTIFDSDRDEAPSPRNHAE